MISNILVICIGNICRSPMAEGRLKFLFPQKNIRSAGICALVGYPAEPFSVQLMREQGIDIGEHRAQNLESWMVREADLILTMDVAQKHFIEQKYASAIGKVYRLCARDDGDIADPYRQDLSAFREACTLITHGVDALASRIGCIK